MPNLFTWNSQVKIVMIELYFIILSLYKQFRTLFYYTKFVKTVQLLKRTYFTIKETDPTEQSLSPYT